jgi:tRNA threonylcarbamoyladenosine biosynthesis protein TsaE
MEESSFSIDGLDLGIESFYYHIRENQMKEVARHYAKKIRIGQMVFLSGELGGGKTTFVKALAGVFGIPRESVKSPTFTLINRYPASGFALYHLDCYRLDESGLEDIGFFDLPLENSVTLVEWPENVKSLFQRVDWLFSFIIPMDMLDVRNLKVYKNCRNTSG